MGISWEKFCDKIMYINRKDYNKKLEKQNRLTKQNR